MRASFTATGRVGMLRFFVLLSTLAVCAMIATMAPAVAAEPAPDAPEDAPAEDPVAAPVVKVMVAGDSVPNGLLPTMQVRGQRRGWDLIDAAQGGCGVRGDLLVNSRNRPFVRGALCPGLVRPLQNAALAQDPDVVVWWDRWTIADFRKSDGTHVRAGTRRWWRLRTTSLALHADRLTAGGAQLVLIATEPVGRGISTRCTPARCHEWHRRLIEQHREYVQGWNLVMRDFAASRRNVHFRTVTNVICRNEAVPCDDRVNGTAARRDGVHYSAHHGRISEALLRRLESVVSTLDADRQ